MNPSDEQKADLELENYDPIEEGYDEGVQPEEDAAQDIQDIDESDFINEEDFEAFGDDVDEQVFGEELPEDSVPAKKGLNWFNIAVGGAAVLVAGGLILMNTMDGGQPSAPAPVAQAQAPQSQATPAAAVQAAVAPTADTETDNTQSAGLLDNPDQFAALSQNQTGLRPEVPVDDGMGDPFAALESQAELPSVPGAAVVDNEPANAQQNVPMPTPISAEPENMASAPAPAPAMDAPVQAMPEMVEAEPLAAPVQDDRASAQVEALQAKLEMLEQKLADQGTPDMLASAPAPVDAGRLDQLQASLERLEKRLDALSTKTQSALDKAEKAVKKTSSAKAVQKTPVKRTSKKVTKTAAKKSTTKNWDKAYVPPAKTDNGAWELRGAREGYAVIAKNGQIREVRLGESVPGLGQITGIATINGRWVVQGTQGRIKQ